MQAGNRDGTQAGVVEVTLLLREIRMAAWEHEAYFWADSL